MIEIPGSTGTTLTTAWFVIRHIGTSAGIISLLGLKGNNTALDINLPTARTGTVHPVGGTDNLVIIPPLAIAIFPGAVFLGNDTMTSRKSVHVLLEKKQPVKKMTHEILQSTMILRNR